MSEKLEKCPFCGVNPYIGMIGRDQNHLKLNTNLAAAPYP